MSIIRFIIKDMKKDKNSSDNDLVTKKYLDKVLDERFAKNTSKIIEHLGMMFDAMNKRFERIDKKLEMLDTIFRILNDLKEYKPNSLEKRVFATT